MSKKILTITDWKYKKELENSISSIIYENKITSIFGRNGSGKSLLIKSIVEIYDYPVGSIELFFKLNEVGVVLQQPEYLIFKEYALDEALLITGNDKVLAEELLELIGAKSNQDALSLSDGQKRLLFIYGYLLSKKIVIFDEPFVSIDSQTREEIERFFIESKSKGVTIIYTSNRRSDLNIAEEIIDMDILIKS